MPGSRRSSCSIRSAIREIDVGRVRPPAAPGPGGRAPSPTSRARARARRARASPTRPPPDRAARPRRRTDPRNTAASPARPAARSVRVDPGRARSTARRSALRLVEPGRRRRPPVALELNPSHHEAGRRCGRGRRERLARGVERLIELPLVVQAAREGRWDRARAAATGESAHGRNSARARQSRPQHGRADGRWLASRDRSIRLRVS